MDPGRTAAVGSLDAVARASRAARHLRSGRSKKSGRSRVPAWCRLHRRQPCAGTGGVSGVVRDVSRLMTASDDILPGTPRVPFSLSMLGWALNEEDSIAGYIDRAG